MANKYPPGMPPLPDLDGYRPRDERSGPPGQRPPQQGPRQPQHASNYPQQRLQQPYERGQQGGGSGGGGRGGRGPNNGARPKRFGFLKGILFGLIALLLIAGAGAAYFILNAPADLVRDKIVAEVKAKTGRDLKISGPASFTLYPNIGVTMRDVSLSPPPGMTGHPLVTMKGLDVSVRILPLLKRDVYIERIILEKPVFELYADKQGRKSWQFAQFFDLAPVHLAQAAPPPASGSPTATDARPDMPADALQSQHATIQQLHFGNVRIDDGTVRYADAVTGAVQEATAINLKVALPDLRQPLNAKGDLAWKGQKIDLDVTLTSLKSMMEDKPARIGLVMASAPVNAQFDGSLTIKDGFDIEGTLSAKSQSARSLAKWLGKELPTAKGFGPLNAKGLLRATANTYSLAGADISLDGATAKGQISVETQNERPAVKTTLTISELDLNKYIGDGAASTAPKSKAAPVGSIDVTPPPAAKSIDDLLKEPKPPASGPRVQGYTHREGWSTEAIDLTGLGAIDADAKLSVGRLLYQDIKVGQSQLTVALKNKVLKTNFDDIQLYSGHGRGFISLDGTAARTANVGANLAFDGIDALPFLNDTAGFDKVSGKAKLNLALAGQGNNQQQLMNALNGKVDFTFANGAINGLNVAGMVRGVTQGKLTGLKTSPTEKTDFSELSSSWTVVGGVANNQDLRLISPLLRLSGSGNVMLGGQQVDYVMKPKLVSSLAGQGGAANEQGLEVPVRVHGPWSKIDYTPDLKGIFSDPNKAVDTLKEIGKQFKGQNAGEALKSILGGARAQPAVPAGQATGTPAAPAAKPTAKQLLEQLLKPQ